MEINNPNLVKIYIGFISNLARLTNPTDYGLKWAIKLHSSILKNFLKALLNEPIFLIDFFLSRIFVLFKLKLQRGNKLKFKSDKEYLFKIFVY